MKMTFTMTKKQVIALREKRAKWCVDADGNIFDADFTFDVVLTMSGDFASNIIKWEYAQCIADALNASDIISGGGS